MAYADWPLVQFCSFFYRSSCCHGDEYRSFWKRSPSPSCVVLHACRRCRYLHIKGSLVEYDRSAPYWSPVKQPPADKAPDQASPQTNAFETPRHIPAPKRCPLVEYGLCRMGKK